VESCSSVLVAISFEVLIFAPMLAAQMSPVMPGQHTSSEAVLDPYERGLSPRSRVGTVGPRRRSQPVRIHRSSSSSSTGPASVNRPAAIKSSPRRAALENQTIRKDAGALYADVVAALRYLAEMINQRLEFEAFRGE
jgi:hypothetical protein